MVDTSERPSWDNYFMEMAELAKTRSTCLRRRVGAILVKDRRVIATGYNGAAVGAMHCNKVGCLREQMQIKSGERQELCRAVHAEQNVITQAAKFGIATEGAVLYCTTFPCATCAKLLINAGITRIWFKESYPDYSGLSADILKHAGVEVINFVDN